MTLDHRDQPDSEIIETGTVWAFASTGIPSSTLSETLLDGSVSLRPEDPISTYTVSDPKKLTTTELVGVSSGGNTYTQTVPGSTVTIPYLSSGKPETVEITQTPTTYEYEIGTTIETYTLQTTVETYPVTRTSIGVNTTKVETQEVITRTAYIDRRGSTPLSRFNGEKKTPTDRRLHLNRFAEREMDVGIIVAMVLASLLIIVAARDAVNRWFRHRYL